MKLLEDAGDGSWAKIERPADINSTAYEVTISTAESYTPAGKRELRESGEVESLD